LDDLAFWPHPNLDSSMSRHDHEEVVNGSPKDGHIKYKIPLVNLSGAQIQVPPRTCLSDRQADPRNAGPVRGFSFLEIVVVLAIMLAVTVVACDYDTSPHFGPEASNSEPGAAYSTYRLVGPG